MIERSVSSTSIVWVCSCGARDVSLTSQGYVDQVEAHLVTCQEVVEARQAAAETVARYARRHGL